MSTESVADAPEVDLDNISFIGSGLVRPESVQVASNGSLFVSARNTGIAKVTAAGSVSLIGKQGRKANGHELIPNGIAPLPDGGFLLANIGEGGGVWRLACSGEMTPYLMEVDGVPLSAANFVMRDDKGRIWITVSTISLPRFDAYSPDVRNGLVIVVDESGPRIVADDICFANECRVSPEGDALFVSETFSRSVTRFDLSERGDLSGREVFCSFGRGDFPDGCRFDSAGHLWLTCIVSNRLWRIAPDGRPTLVLEDRDPAHVSWVEDALGEGRMGREHFYTAGGTKLGNVASIAFSEGGDRAFLGSLCGDAIATFSIPPHLRRS